MGVAEEIRELAGDVSRKWKRVRRSEAATKTSLILPFIAALGYDIHEPDEFDAEFLADVGTKKHEKVDYAVVKDRKPIILIECKKAEISLGKGHLSQLIRYYAVTDARFGILTNGVEYQFYTDLRKRNVMDESPFLVVNMLDLKEGQVEEVSRFAKSAFDAQAIWDIVYAREIEQRDLQSITANISREFANPSKELVRIFARGVLGKGYQRPSEWTRVTQLTKRALDQLTGKHDPGNSVPVPPLPDPVPPRHASEPDFSIYPAWTKADVELKQFFMAFHDYVFSLGGDIEVNPKKSYISFDRVDYIVSVKLRTYYDKGLVVFSSLDPGTVTLKKGFTRDISKMSSYPGRLEIIIQNHNDFERAKPLIKRSYEEAG